MMLAYSESDLGTSTPDQLPRRIRGLSYTRSQLVQDTRFESFREV